MAGSSVGPGRLPSRSGIVLAALIVGGCGVAAAAVRPATQGLSGRAEVPGAMTVSPAELADPREVDVDPGALSRVDALLLGAVADSIFPGAALAVGRRGRLVRLRGYGHLDRDGEDAATPSTLWDLASLTKVMGTTTAIALLEQEGRVELDAPVVRYLPWWAGGHGAKREVTVRQLLLHRAGLPGFRPWFRERRGPSAYRRAGAAEPLVGRPGESTVYSDLGAMTLGWIVEEVSGIPLDRFLEERVFAPLGMRETRFRPDEVPRHRIAPTERDTLFRHTHLRGEVHDENAWAMGGVAGHAGLFGSARDLAVFAGTLLAGGVLDGCDGARVGSGVVCPPGGRERIRLLEEETVDRYVRRHDGGASRALGWDTPAGRSSAGDHFTSAAFGHTGFTGTSMWIDPDLDLFVVLLTNRVNPSRAETRHVALRRALHDAVALALTDREPEPRR